MLILICLQISRWIFRIILSQSDIQVILFLTVAVVAREGIASPFLVSPVSFQERLEYGHKWLRFFYEDQLTQSQY
jgi:hypothetical protein